MRKNYFLLTFALFVASITYYSQVPTIFTVSPQMQCASVGGNTAAVTASSTAAGITSFSWVVSGSGTCTPSFTNSAVNGSVINVSLSCCGFYTLTCISYSNTTPMFTVSTSATVFCTPNLSVTATPTAICSGNVTTLTPVGALMYTLMPGNLVNTNSFFLTPTATTCYTLLGSSPAGCVGQSNLCLGVYPLPTVGIVGSNTACLASNSILTATGTATSYSWDIGPTTTTISVFNYGNYCYTLTGVDANGCSNTATHCVTSVAGPTFLINSSAAGSTLCAGSGVTLTANSLSAVSYTWNTSPAVVSPTLYVIPPAGYTQYTANATDINGCVSTMTSNIIAFTTCAVVWPGDANRDGVVTTSDVLELGLWANSTGPARTATSIAWAAQTASAWTGTISTGWNRAHADCNGDGIINAADNAAITANFSFTHTFKGAPSSAAGPEIKLVPQLNVAYGGVWNKADILLGDATNSLNIYGVAFDLNYDQSLIVPDSVKLIYTSSFLNATNANIEFGKPVFGNGKVFAATVRTNQQNASGFGKIGELWYKVKSGLPQNASINLWASNGISINSAGITSTVAAGAQISLLVNYNVTGLTDATSFDNGLVCWPNPAGGFINVKTATNSVCNYSLHDLSGRTVLSGSFQSQHTIDLSGLESGIYFLHTENIGVISSLKVVRQ